MPSMPSKNEFIHELVLPRIGVGVIVRFPPIHGTSRPRFAWLRRSGTSHGNGEWSLPGGRLEFYETLESCASREVYEELGIKKFDHFYRIPFISEDFFPEDKEKFQIKMHWVTFYFVAYPHYSEVAKLMEPDKADALAVCYEPPGDLFSGAKEAIKFVNENNLWVPENVR